MNKKLILGAVVVVLVGAGYLYASAGLISKTITVTTYTHGGEATSSALVSVRFNKGLDRSVTSVWLDLNGDGSYGDGEIVVNDAPLNPQRKWNSGYYFDSPEGLAAVTRGRVTVDGKQFDVKVRHKTIEVGELYDLATVTDPLNAMKGLGLATAYAQDVEITNDGVPDINQRRGECAPTSAANSLINLVRENGDSDDLPSNPTDLIDDLKEHMRWTPENGVLPDDFVRGKNDWAAANGLPIRTEKVGDAQGTTTIDAIREALENGEAVELRIRFSPDGRSVEGGHMVTVTGIHSDGDQTYIDINDPGTPDSGTEQVEIRGNTIANYGPYAGITVLGWGFVQTWVGEPTGVQLDGLSADEIRGIREFVGETNAPIKVIRHGPSFIPTSHLFIVDKEDGCEDGAAHWHASAGSATRVDGREIQDPGGCGYGTLEDNPSIDLPE